MTARDKPKEELSKVQACIPVALQKLEQLQVRKYLEFCKLCAMLKNLQHLTDEIIALSDLSVVLLLRSRFSF